MSSDDDMVDITTSGTTEEGTLPTDLQYQPQGTFYSFILQSWGKIVKSDDRFGKK